MGINKQPETNETPTLRSRISSCGCRRRPASRALASWRCQYSDAVVRRGGGGGGQGCGRACGRPRTFAHTTVLPSRMVAAAAPTARVGTDTRARAPTGTVTVTANTAPEAGTALHCTATAPTAVSMEVLAEDRPDNGADGGDSRRLRVGGCGGGGGGRGLAHHRQSWPTTSCSRKHTGPAGSTRPATCSKQPVTPSHSLGPPTRTGCAEDAPQPLVQPPAGAPEHDVIVGRGAARPRDGRLEVGRRPTLPARGSHQSCQ
jgi:hypothetical protein